MGIITNRRRVMGGNPLPYDAVVEYLEGNGNSYILSDIMVSPQSIINILLIDFFKPAMGGAWPFGGRKAYLANAFGFYLNRDTSNLDVAFGGRLMVTFNISSLGSTSALVELKNGLFSVGGKSYNFSAVDFTPTNTIALFGLNNNGNIIAAPGVKIGRCYLSDGNKELDLIPVRVGTIGYMYDKVSGQLFGNAGTGQFVLGPDV